MIKLIIDQDDDYPVFSLYDDNDTRPYWWDRVEVSQEFYNEYQRIEKERRQIQKVLDNLFRDARRRKARRQR